MTDMISETEALAYADRAVAQAYQALEAAVELLKRTLDRARAAQGGSFTGGTVRLALHYAAFHLPAPV